MSPQSPSVPSTSRIVVYCGPGEPLRTEIRPVPPLQPGEILVKVVSTTICGSDLHTFAGRRTIAGPTILGHEILGTVVAGDPLPRGISIGDRVTWTLCDSCGQCESCRRGIPQKCLRLRKYGHEADSVWPLSGGLADYCCLRPGTTVFRVNDSLPDAVACPANCATATVAAALRIAGTAEDATVVILGCGMLGLTAAAMARHRGARQVIAADLTAARAARALDFGATAAVGTAETPDALEAAVASASGGRGADVVLEMSGPADAVERGLGLCRVGGAMVLVGSTFTDRPAAVSAERVVRGLLRIQGIHNYLPGDLAGALDFLVSSQNQYDFAGLVAATYRLDQAQEAFAAALAERPIRLAIRP